MNAPQKEDVRYWISAAFFSAISGVILVQGILQSESFIQGVLLGMASGVFAILSHFYTSEVFPGGRDVVE